MRRHINRFLRTSDGTLIDLKGKDTHCPVCRNEGRGGVLRFSFGDFSIIECGSCSTLYLSPLPTPESIASIYNTAYYQDSSQEHGYSDYGADVTIISRTYARRLKKVSEALLKRGRSSLKHVHEIGCALGFGLTVAKEYFRGAEITGSDISHEAVAAAKEAGFTAGLCNSRGISDLFDDLDRADLIYMFDVIEHLSDIPVFREWVSQQLVDNGHLLITTPDMGGVLNRVLGSRSPSIKIPQHLIYFETETLCRALAPQFKLIGCWLDFQYVGVGMLLNQALHVVGLRPSRALENLRLGVPTPNGMKLYLFEKC